MDILKRIPIGVAILGIFLWAPLSGDDCNLNQVDDAEDVSSGRSKDCNQNLVPDECDIAAAFTLLPSVIASGADFRQVACADLDGDGLSDVASADGVTGTVSVFLSRGDGTFRRGAPVSVPRPIALEAGDLDRDGDIDLVASSELLEPRGQIWAIGNNGSGDFVSSISFPVVGNWPVRTMSADYLVLADFDGDGDLDLATANDVISRFDGAPWFRLDASIFTNDGDGNLTQTSMIIVRDDTRPLGIASADLDRDGLPDLAVASFSGVHVFLDPGVGNLFEAATLTEGFGSYSVAAADMERDGKSELIIGVLFVDSTGQKPEVKRVCFHSWAGGFGPPVDCLPIRFAPERALAADLDGDRALEVAVVDQDRHVSIFKKAHAKGFLLAAEAQMDVNIHSAASADLDGDGRSDLVLPIEGNVLRLLSSEVIPARSTDWNDNGIPDECEGPFFHRGDPNGDGGQNIADAVFILMHLFTGGEAPSCADSADVDDSGVVNISDAIFLLRFLFQSGLPPPDPGPPGLPCGPDPAPGPEGSPGCEDYPNC